MPMLTSSPSEDVQLAAGRADTNRVLVRPGAAGSAGHESRVVEWFAELTRLVRRAA